MSVKLFRRVFVALLGFAAFAHSAPGLSLPPAEDSLARAISLATLRADYVRATTLALQLRARHAAAGCVFSAMVGVSRFDDLGDTVALRRASRELDTCKADGLWEALRLFELGYAHSVLGNPVQAALKTRGAALHFKQSPDTDAQAFYAIYAYYVDQLTAGLSWMPFVSDKRVEHLAALRKGANSQSPYWALFSTPLAWIYYDRKEYSTALQVVDKMLLRSPGHPVFLQMRADMLFMLKRYPEAVAIYEQSVLLYKQRNGRCLRYWCAVGNLARIYHAMGKPEQAHNWAIQLSDPAFATIRRWMPSSLMDDLDERDLLP